MKFKVVWSAQVHHYIHSKAPVPRREMLKEIKSLAAWDGREDLPRIRHLEDDMAGYSRLRIKGERVIFRQAFENGQRVIKCLFAKERSTVYEIFRQLLLDELSS